MTAPARRRSWMPRTPSGWAFVALVAVIVLTVPLAVWFYPILQARSQFPSLTEAQRLALIVEVAERRVAGFPAFDAEGAEVTVARGTMSTATPGRCSVVHDRWPHPDQTRGRAGRWDVSGRATFHCLYAVEAEGHGPLRAVVRMEYLTNPPERWTRSAPRALEGTEGRAMIRALERAP